MSSVKSYINSGSSTCSVKQSREIIDFMYSGYFIAEIEETEDFVTVDEVYSTYKRVTQLPVSIKAFVERMCSYLGPLTEDGRWYGIKRMNSSDNHGVSYGEFIDTMVKRGEGWTTTRSLHTAYKNWFKEHYPSMIAPGLEDFKSNMKRRLNTDVNSGKWNNILLKY
jgi:hypothetical protein